MKTILLIFLLLFGLNSLKSQNSVYFYYDEAGNRNKRTIELPQLKSARDSTNSSKVDLNKEQAKIEAKFSFESLADGKIKVFPNPTEGKLMVRLDNISNTENINLKLYNSSGSLLQTKQGGPDMPDFDMQYYSPGIYILLISLKDERLEYKIIKQ